MPSELDIIRVALLFADQDDEAILNQFTMRLANLVTGSWSGVADEIESLFNSMYSEVAEDWAMDVQSEEFKISLRDEGAGQWNEVYHRNFTDIAGGTPSDPYSSITTATIVAFPGLVRHWGFKNLACPAEGNIAGGRLTPAGLANMVLFGADYAVNWQGTETDLSQGVYNEASETYRPFAGSILVKDALGSRVTRKIGRGI